ncbi:hypothetical protein B0H14DRAFT_2609979 [Mycena olivaceomarginata]|nr:hypothetical protein B0H14DRAFT_2609979 [Mycena olivaceomarginata]
MASFLFWELFSSHETSFGAERSVVVAAMVMYLILEIVINSSFNIKTSSGGIGPEQVLSGHDYEAQTAGISEEEPSEEEAETQSSVDDGEISADDANDFESQNTESEEDSNDEFRRVVQIIRVFERRLERLQNIESTLLWLGAEKIDPVRELCGTVIRCGGEFELSLMQTSAVFGIIHFIHKPRTFSDRFKIGCRDFLWGQLGFKSTRTSQKQ